MDQSQMNTQQLMDTARALVAGGKGLLAMDESKPTCNKRFPFTVFSPRGSHSADPGNEMCHGRSKFIASADSGQLAPLGQCVSLYG